MLTLSPTRDHRLIASLNEEVQNLHHQMHPELFKPYDRAAMDAALETFFSNANCTCYIVSDNGKPVGYVILLVKEVQENAFHYAIRSLHIDQIAVLGEHRRSGAGALLMEQAEKLAKEMGIGRLQLDHWSANTVAATYFRSKGYTLYREQLFKLI